MAVHGAAILILSQIKERNPPETTLTTLEARKQIKY